MFLEGTVLGNIRRKASSTTFSGLVKLSAPHDNVLSPPGQPEWKKYFLFRILFGEVKIFEQLLTTIK